MRVMFVPAQSHLKALLSYMLFVGGLTLTAHALGESIAFQTLSLAPQTSTAERSEPSRVERFLLDKIAASQAPQIPVPRVVSVLTEPDIPVQLLAMRLDEAESGPREVLRLPSAQSIAVLGAPDDVVAVVSAELDPLEVVAQTSASVKSKDASRVAKAGLRKVIRASLKTQPTTKAVVQQQVPLAASYGSTLVKASAGYAMPRSASARDIIHRSLGAVIFVN